MCSCLQAMDGFLLIISTTGEILFSSESIKDFIGIFQVNYSSYNRYLHNYVMLHHKCAFTTAV